MDWKALELAVCEAAESKWGVKASAEHLVGVDFDLVLRGHIPDEDSMAVIEITKNHTLEKVRNDINKLISVRELNIRNGVMGSYYIVLEKEPTNSMKETAAASKIKIMSYADFLNSFTSNKDYLRRRQDRAFGSSVHPVTGKKDENPYVPVKYVSSSGNSYSLEDIVSKLSSSNIVLLGEYGTGKSRCIREIFEYVASQDFINVFCTDLKDHGGLKRGAEIIRRHLSDLGLEASTDIFVRLNNEKKILLLLDGYDEVSTSQDWSVNHKKIKELRRVALEGVSDLVRNRTKGVFITGRPHFFDSDEEMISALKMDMINTIILRCADEFTEGEVDDFFANLSGVKNNKFPRWLPKKPLICQIVESLPSENIDALSNSELSQYDFWGLFLDLMCTREARIATSLDTDSVKEVLIEIAACTRTKKDDDSRISLAEMEGCFEKALGEKPSDASVTMLQRLMSLSRVNESNTSDRRFIDFFILDGLRAEHIFKVMNEPSPKIDYLNGVWRNCLKDFGLSILSRRMESMPNKMIESHLSKIDLASNKQIFADFFAAYCRSGTDFLFDKMIDIEAAEIDILDFMDKKSKNITFSSCVIRSLDVTRAIFESGGFKDCDIFEVNGISSKTPDLIFLDQSNSISRIVSVGNINAIERLGGISENQKIFLELVNKIFFQFGGGREEKTIYQGYDNSKRERITVMINYLVKADVVTKKRDSKGVLYTPNPILKGRLVKIRESLSLSTDAIWMNIPS